MKLLVVSQSYPSEKNLYQNAFIHSRCCYYRDLGIDFDVLSFSCTKPYIHEGINVYPEKDILTKIRHNNYNAAILHSPNLRNHLRFFWKNKDKLNKFFFILHGFEVLQTSVYYPKPYHFTKSTPSFIVNIYDKLKRIVLKALISKYIGHKIKLIFVSNYLKNIFLDNVSIDKELVENNSDVIPNPINKYLIDTSYSSSKKRKNLAVTIRSFDKSVYAVDILVKIALSNPDYEFHLYGKGDYFKHNKQPKNLLIKGDFINPTDFKNLLDEYQLAIMPSRHDSQGVMACEMAYFGIPLIASNTPAAQEFLSKNENVRLIDNTDPQVDIKSFLAKNNNDNQLIHSKLSLKNTIYKEIDFIKSNIS